ncbi:MAG TPA: Hsp33 family molecular chaperone HslO [Spirochaetia bacterium]|nr:Hsp33 family molecular chaperone HslO [Spirochaetia bacterium]
MILRRIENPELVDHFERILTDGTDLFLFSRGTFRAAILHGTRLVNQMRANHELGILETLILGHAYMASALMATTLKGGDRIGIHLRCDGPVAGVHVESTARGQVRGYLDNSAIPLERPLDSFDTAPFIGNGILSVTRYMENSTQPFTGQIELKYGNIAQDLTRYYAVSEQTPTSITLSIHFDSQGLVTGAGGLLVQGLPARTLLYGADDAKEDQIRLEAYDETVARMEKTVQTLPSIGSLFAEGRSPSEVIHSHFAQFDPDVIGTRPLEFACNCTRDRFRRFIGSLPAAELDDIVHNGPFPLHITCHNCNSVYAFREEEIRAIHAD